MNEDVALTDSNVTKAQHEDDRSSVLDAARAYYRNRVQTPFVPGETYIPPSGKVIEEDDLASLIDASLDMWLTAGRYSTAFEERLARKFGTRYARMTVSGSAANLLAFTCLTSQRQRNRIEPGSEVLTVAASFPTTVTPIIQNDCVPVFVDIDATTHNVDVEQLKEAVTPKTRAIMLAHSLGNPFDVEAVKKIADEHALYLIEDCCDAFGAKYDGKMSVLSAIQQH